MALPIGAYVALDEVPYVNGAYESGSTGSRGSGLRYSCHLPAPFENVEREDLYERLYPFHIDVVQ